MAYTTSTLSTSSTLVGTSGNDTGAVAAAVRAVTVNSYEGNDTLTFGGATTSATIGMGAGNDSVDTGGAALTSGTINLGAGTDTFTNDAGDDGITVGGQDGVDTFLLTTATTATTGANRYAGGKGADVFNLTAAHATITTSIVGGADADTLSVGAQIGDDGTSKTFFFNGQKGADTFSTTGDTLIEDATIRGGSEADTINVSTVTTGGNIVGNVQFYGDKGADTITGSSGAESIFGGGGADVIDANAGVDYISLGEGADKITLAAGDGATGGSDLTDAQILAQSGTMTGLTAELVVGFDTGDTLTTTSLGTAKSMVADLTAGTMANNQAYFVRGTYNSTLQTFVLSSTGDDVLLSMGVAGATANAQFDVSAINLDLVVFDNAASASAFFG